MRAVPAHQGPPPELDQLPAASAVLPSPDPDPVLPSRVWLDLRDLPWREQLDLLEHLQDGYAGPGSVAPGPEIVSHVRGQLSLTTYPVASVLPDGREGVIVTHRNGYKFAVYRVRGGPDDGLWIEFSSKLALAPARRYRL